MKPIQSSLKAWMNRSESFKENYQKMKQELLQDAEIKEFLAIHPELGQEEIDKSLIKLYEYKSQSKQCDQCASFGQCINMVQGYSPILQVTGDEIHIRYEKCHSRLLAEKEQEQNKLIQSLYMPKEILEARLSDIDNDSSRTQVLLKIFDFLEQAKQEIPKKGLYLHGIFGVGKTFLLGALANELKKYNISSTIIYMPEFVREMKASLKDDSVNKKMDLFKTTDILMLDDIGAEMHSAWFRDEILSSILQYRMMEGLPVFFTSNYNLEQLETHLATTRTGVETLKAARIIERIQQVSDIMQVQGYNRRK
ncbi:primosomal protein DnaI [Oceanobacillus alkalisoli]|uniref:primosomal protein DnaI n=1 Tax=Oceanobacillus alkalisoli TaxID=2925113 RepID=UPI001F11D167|nr:primosomal protein DnaI [Oceanobacillus alkalisoli]MCF3942562.1 primosomal protein DnaI [Oceanobacillus alkalisoli]